VQIKFDNLLICDQARREDNGKVFLIGLYTGTINVTKAPLKLSLTYWLIGNATPKGKIGKVKFELQTDYKSESGVTSIGPKTFEIEADAEAVVDGCREFQFGIGGVPLEIEEVPGTLIVKIRAAGEKRWRQLVKKSILYSMPSNEQQQPS
jgi:hypothetical protein